LPHRQASSSGARRLAALALALALGAALLLTIVPASRAQPAPAAPTVRGKLERVSVSVDPAEAGAPVPQDFLGLSFEVAALSQLAGYATHGDLVTLLRSLGVGVLRFGGVTADEQIAWRDERTPRPSWALGVLEAGSLWELGSLAQASGWHVLLTLGMGHYAPQAAAREAAVAKAALGSSLEALELGNEPDAYAAHGLRTQPWTFVQYSEQVSAYRAAIEALAPGIPLAGPDTSGSSAYESWGPGEAVDQRPALLTGHHYPMGCKEQPAPSIARLLSPQIRKLEKRSLHRYLLVAEEAGIPFRMDEANTVSCGGVPGISDTFASALWAVAYVTRAMSMGAAGINLESNPNNCVGYTLLCALTPEAAADGELSAQPEWYALLLAKALLGERPLPTSITAPRRANLVVSAFLARDGTLHYVIVDDDPPGARRAAVSLHVGRGFHGASILSLTAPSPQALAGVRLGGQAVAPDGLWSEPAELPRAVNRDGVITVDVRPSSAALLTVSPVANVTTTTTGGSSSR
jgi:hypothetical protein